MKKNLLLILGALAYTSAALYASDAPPERTLARALAADMRRRPRGACCGLLPSQQTIADLWSNLHTTIALICDIDDDTHIKKEE